MPVIDITKDVDNRTLTVTAEFAAHAQRVWALYADPRQLVTFDSADDMQNVLDIGTGTGLRDAINEIDGFLTKAGGEGS